MRNFKELKVWQKAHDLTLEVYKATSTFPRDELYGLTSQIRRSCSSIPANIAEGCGRKGDAEYDRLTADVTEIKRMLTSFIQKLNADS